MSRRRCWRSRLCSRRRGRCGRSRCCRRGRWLGCRWWRRRRSRHWRRRWRCWRRRRWRRLWRRCWRSREGSRGRGRGHEACGLDLRPGQVRLGAGGRLGHRHADRHDEPGDAGGGDGGAARAGDQLQATRAGELVGEHRGAAFLRLGAQIDRRLLGALAQVLREIGDRLLEDLVAAAIDFLWCRLVDRSRCERRQSVALTRASIASHNPRAFNIFFPKSRNVCEEACHTRAQR